MVLDTFISVFQNLISDYDYIALFISSIISASTVIIPMPLYVLIFFASSLGLNPLIVGIVSGVGSGIGEITGYLVGVGSRRVLRKRIKHIPHKIENLEILFKKYGFWALILLGVLPFPFDVIGIISGASGFGVKKFLLAAIIGKVVKNLMIAYAGYFTLPYIEVFLHPIS